MSITVFIIVTIAFSVVLLYKRSSQEKEKQPETSITIQPPTPESDDYIRILALNPKEYGTALEFGKDFENRLDQILGYYQVKNCKCNIEFVTVGLCLAAVIHIRTLPGKKKKGIDKLWNRQ